MSEAETPFPTLIADEPPLPWAWPLPPARRMLPPPAIGSAQPCLIELQVGTTLNGTMVGFDPAMRRLDFRSGHDGPEASLPFSRLRRLTLTTPLQPAPRERGAPRERLPTAAQERDYVLQQIGDDRAEPMTGRTAGHVAAPEGMYLFVPKSDEGTLQRVFVPRSAYSRCEFGASAEEQAAQHWIASPKRLLEAIAEQQRQAVRPLGQSLLALGLLTPSQLDRALAAADGKTALGESLLASGLVSRTDLQTALAHKMGYPLVDVERFPLDPAALALLPRRLAIAHRMLPLMRDGERLIVAVDRPARVLKLRQLDAYAGVQIAPALALKAQIMVALNRQSGDGWNLNVSERAAFFETTVF